jgi:hypothetical protein
MVDQITSEVADFQRLKIRSCKVGGVLWETAACTWLLGAQIAPLDKALDPPTVDVASRTVTSAPASLAANAAASPAAPEPITITA